MHDLLRAARALTLCGTGGIGKSRLAVRMLTALTGDFPDGVWFIELGDLQQSDLIARVAAAVGVVEERGQPLLETLAAALAPRRMLLALDNCEHLIDAVVDLAREVLARCPNVTVLATSREALMVDGERSWPVPSLSVRDGLASPAV